jgi:hypothetical protein
LIARGGWLDEPNVAIIAFQDPEEPDAVELSRKLFPDGNYVPGPPGAPGWQTLSSGDSPLDPLTAVKGKFAILDRRQAWQPSIANLAANRALRLQRNVLFSHATSVHVVGEAVMERNIPKEW